MVWSSSKGPYKLAMHKQALVLQMSSGNYDYLTLSSLSTRFSFCYVKKGKYKSAIGLSYSVSLSRSIPTGNFYRIGLDWIGMDSISKRGLYHCVYLKFTYYYLLVYGLLLNEYDLQHAQSVGMRKLSWRTSERYVPNDTPQKSNRLILPASLPGNIYDEH